MLTSASKIVEIKNAEAEFVDGEGLVALSRHQRWLLPPASWLSAGRHRPHPRRRLSVLDELHRRRLGRGDRCTSINGSRKREYCERSQAMLKKFNRRCARYPDRLHPRLVPGSALVGGYGQSRISFLAHNDRDLSQRTLNCDAWWSVAECLRSAGC